MKLTGTCSIGPRLAGLAWIAGVLGAAAVDSMFSYQGYLADSGSSANGSYDFTFALYDAPTNGAQVGGCLTNTDVGVTNGQFTVALDFGASAFDGGSRWLEIGVRSGTNNFTTLTPRQRVTATPYALYAAAGGTPLAAGTNVSISFAGGTNLINVAGGGLPLAAGSNVTVYTMDGTNVVNANVSPAQLNGKVSQTGDTMTGPLTLSGTNLFICSTNLANGAWFALYNGCLMLPRAENSGPTAPGMILLGVDDPWSADPVQGWSARISSGRSGMLLAAQNFAIEPGWLGGRGGLIRLGNDGNWGDMIFLSGEPYMPNSKTLAFRTSVWSNDTLVNIAYPGIQGWMPPDPRTYYGDGSHEGRVGLGELWFFAGVPLSDDNGFNYHLGSALVFKMLTNGMDFRGKLVQEKRYDVINTTNYVIDLNSAYCLDLSLTTDAVTFATTNWLGGDTNIETRVILLHARVADCALRFPAGWLVASESGTATTPTNLAVFAGMRIHLESLGLGESNILASFQIFPEPYFWDPDASNFLARVGGLTPVQSNAVNRFAIDLKRHGLWGKFDAIYPFVGGTADRHQHNLISSRFPISWNGTVTHDLNGVTGDGMSGYGDTGFNPTKAGGQYQTDSSSIVMYCGTLLADPGVFAGAQDASGVHRAYVWNNSGWLQAAGFNEAEWSMVAVIPTSDFHGFLAGVRTSSTNMVVWLGSSRSGIESTPTTGTPDATFFALARNSAGDGADNFSNENLRLLMIGGGLSSGQISLLQQDIQAFETRLNRDAQ